MTKARAGPLSRSWMGFPNPESGEVSAELGAPVVITQEAIGLQVGLTPQWPTGAHAALSLPVAQGEEVKTEEQPVPVPAFPWAFPNAATVQDTAVLALGLPLPGLRLVVGAGLTPFQSNLPAGVSFYSSPESVSCASVYLPAPGIETFATFPAFLRYRASAGAFP